MRLLILLFFHVHSQATLMQECINQKVYFFVDVRSDADIIFRMETNQRTARGGKSFCEYSEEIDHAITLKTLLRGYQQRVGLTPFL